MFRTNGFDFVEGAEGRLLLAGVPFSRGTTFGAADVRELVALLDAGGTAPMALGTHPGTASSASTQQQGSVVRPSRWVAASSGNGRCILDVLPGPGPTTALPPTTPQTGCMAR